MVDRLMVLVESRIHRNVYVRFGGEFLKSRYSNIEMGVRCLSYSVIGSSWRDVNYMKGLPRPSSKAPSEAQLMQRKRFQVVVKFLSQIRDLLDESYGKQDLSRATGYNLAIQEVLLHAVTGIYPDYTIDYPKVLMSKGSLYTTPKLSISSEAAAGVVNVKWKSVINKFNSFSSDIVTVVLYNTAKNLFVVDQSATRQDEVLDIDVSADFSADKLQCYLYFMSTEKGRLSPSIYGGEVTVF